MDIKPDAMYFYNSVVFRNPICMKISFGKTNFRLLAVVVCLLFDITPVWAISTVSGVADATLTFDLLAGSTTSKIYGVLQSPESLVLSNANEGGLLPGDNVSLTSGNLNLNTSAVSLSDYSLNTGSVGLLGLSGGSISLSTGMFVSGVNISLYDATVTPIDYSQLTATLIGGTLTGGNATLDLTGGTLGYIPPYSGTLNGILIVNGNIPAVPEPDIVLMMIIGIGVLGAVVRRRAVVLPEKPGS